MNTDVIAVASAKGGVGKTTTASNLGAALAQRTSVLLLEADLGLANVLDFLDLPYDPERDPSLHDVLAGEAELAEAVVEAPCGLAVLPAGDDVQGFRKARPDALPTVVATARSQYDVIVIDTPAGVGQTSLLPLGIADGVLLVSTPRVSAVRDTEKTKSLVDRVGGTVGGVLITMTGSGNAPPPERLATFLDVQLVGDVPEDATVARAQDAGQPVVEYEPTSPAAEAYLEAAEQLGQVATQRANRANSENPG